MLGAQGQFKWIPFPAGGYDEAVCSGISGDGTTVVGYADIVGGPANGRRGWYWNAEDGTNLIPLPAGYLQMVPYAVNYDGTIVVGGCRDSDASGLWTAFRWDKDTGVTTDLLLAAGTKGTARAVSADGDKVTIIGDPGGSSGVSQQQGAVWISGTGLVPLEVPPDPFGSAPSPCYGVAISGDGSVVGGNYAKFLAGVQSFPPVIWDGTTGDLIDVLTLDFSTVGTIISITHDGSLALGFYTANPGAQFTSGRSIWLSRTGKTIFGNPSTSAHAFFTVPLDGVYTFTPYSGVGHTETLGRRPFGGDVYPLSTDSLGNPCSAVDGLVYAFHTSNGVHNQVGRLTMLARV